ncbi:effector-associated domain EAD1-containing protein [Streptomyces fuscigenes]|uniref:effector-associated domain EAD1-containing protein n=1 Tax=Streptomyces fuscigenes TaxID=1528880 RepID=UPI001F46CECC|nr:effector-associated domain EAD1-containing protein [Streptomyces fuscigenes]MCF3962590.1 effector-associated domain EAD1-containing protein [Streptomyces fuscigenes]
MSFLDRRSFPLGDPDAVLLLDALLSTHHDYREIKLFAAQAGVRPALFASTGSAAEVWPQVLEGAAHDGLLRRLVEIVAHAPTSRGITVFRDLLDSAGALAEDPFHVHLFDLGGSRVLLDRDVLRECLREFVGGQRVLIITGARRSGKSHSWHLIRHVARHHDAEAYRIDLGLWEGGQMGPGELMTLLAEEMALGNTCDVDQDAADTFRVLRYLSWFKGQVRNGPQRWLVFDGLDTAPLTDPALHLIEKIAAMADAGEANEKTRVVLIDYSRSRLPGDVDDRALRERIGPLEPAHLRNFFQRVARSNGLELKTTEVDGLVDAVLCEAVGAGLPAGPLSPSLVAPSAARHARKLMGAGDG